MQCIRRRWKGIWRFRRCPNHCWDPDFPVVVATLTPIVITFAIPGARARSRVPPHIECVRGRQLSSVQLTRATRLTAATLNFRSNYVNGSVGSYEHNAVEQHSRKHILVQPTICDMFALV